MARIMITIPPAAAATGERKRLAGQFGPIVEEEIPDPTPDHPEQTKVVRRREPLPDGEAFWSAQATWWARNVRGTDVARRWRLLTPEERETALDNAEGGL